MVTACISDGMGFSLLTPTLLIDGFVEHMRLRVMPLPVAGLSRTLTVVARDAELQSLPAEVAALARGKLNDEVGRLMGDVGLAALRVP